MKASLPIALAFALMTSCVTSSGHREPVTYDADLASRLGADQYGMSSYVIAFLEPGPNRGQAPAEAARIQRDHQANIRRMAEMGKLVAAGPFIEDDEYRGIYIFAVDSVEEARTLTETDPAIRAGRLVMKMKRWYGPAALKLLNEWHPRLARENP